MGIETMVAPRRTNRVSMTGRLDTGNDYSQLRKLGMCFTQVAPTACGLRFFVGLGVFATMMS